MGEASSIRGPNDYVHFRPNSPTRVIHNPGDLGTFIEKTGAGSFPGSSRPYEWPTVPANIPGTMRVAVCHSPHTRCGVREYGIALDESLRKLSNVVSASFVDVEGAAAIMGRGDVLLVHFEPSVVDKSRFRGMLNDLISRGAKIVFCCHFFSSEVFNDWRDVVHRFVVHRGYGSGNHQIVEIPLGAPVYWPPDGGQVGARIRRGLPHGKTILLTCGFLSPWKKMPELVAAVLATASGEPDMLVAVQAPTPFFGDSSGEEIRLREVCARHPQNRWHLSTEFLGTADLLDLAHAADVGFIYHSTHTGSVSAATKQFVSARRPVVVTSSTHSADLDVGCHRVGSLDLGHFASEVVALARDKSRLRVMEADMEREYDRINMDVVAARYVALFREI